jgi:hypothetical protein
LSDLTCAYEVISSVIALTGFLVLSLCDFPAIYLAIYPVIHQLSTIDMEKQQQFQQGGFGSFNTGKRYSRGCYQPSSGRSTASKNYQPRRSGAASRGFSGRQTVVETTRSTPAPAPVPVPVPAPAPAAPAASWFDGPSLSDSIGMKSTKTTIQTKSRKDQLLEQQDANQGSLIQATRAYDNSAEKACINRLKNTQFTRKQKTSANKQQRYYESAKEKQESAERIACIMAGGR